MNKDEINYVVDIALDDIIEQCKVVVDVRELLEEDLIVSSEAGIMNPLDQLKQFITDLINTIASWVSESIGSAVKGFEVDLGSFTRVAQGCHNLYQGRSRQASQGPPGDPKERIRLLGRATLELITGLAQERPDRITKGLGQFR